MTYADPSSRHYLTTAGEALSGFLDHRQNRDLRRFADPAPIVYQCLNQIYLYSLVAPPVILKPSGAGILC